jgi:hypothetical protein
MIRIGDGHPAAIRQLHDPAAADPLGEPARWHALPAPVGAWLDALLAEDPGLVDSLRLQVAEARRSSLVKPAPRPGGGRPGAAGGMDLVA